MGTKVNPGQFDCHARAEFDEPIFVLRANDVTAPALVELWAEWHPTGEKYGEARRCAAAMRSWREQADDRAPENEWGAAAGVLGTLRSMWATEVERGRRGLAHALADCIARVRLFLDSPEHSHENALATRLNVLADEVHAAVFEKGFYENTDPTNVYEQLGRIDLIHEEVAEITRAVRKGDAPSEKINGFTEREEEVADSIIRLLDYAGWNNLNVGGAIVAKLAHNRTRPHKHGRKA